MRRTEAATTWVVYRMTIPSQAVSGNVVCEQAEWEALERIRPGYHVLLHSGIATEQEAEKLARGTAGDTYRKGSGRRPGRGQAGPGTPPVAPGAAPA